MFRRFFGDERGNYMLLTAAAIVPIMGGLALSVDYSQMAAQRQETLNALDAAGIATARYMLTGTVTEDQTKAYAKSFFEANLGSVKPADTVLTIVLPQNNTGGGTLKLTAGLKYKPYFFPTFAWMIGKGTTGSTNLDFAATSEIRLKNTLEVALVLDNSGSMADGGPGAGGKSRMELLKLGITDLVKIVAKQAQFMKQVNKPVTFAVVPFAASVNIGSGNKTQTWMDQDGISPIHHENFDWSTFTASNKKVEATAGVYYKKGTGWGTEANQKVTRFTLYDRDIKRITGTSGGNPVYAPYASWAGCVEARPSPYNTNDTTPSTATPATLFVPMFAPDEPGDRWNTSPSTTFNDYDAADNWWNDVTESSGGSTRQTYMPKYFTAAPQGTSAASGDDGPNASCTTQPITDLTDVSGSGGLDVIVDAIDDMQPLGATNVPEGLAWGWRVLSKGAPFTLARPDEEKGNTKVVILLTDGANTYYTPSSLGYDDPAGNKSTYSAYGYAGKWNALVYATSRIFLGTPASVSKTDYSNSNYTKAMNEQFKTLCDNAKAANVTLITVALDLDASDTTEKAQMDALKACASDNPFGGVDPITKLQEKFYVNATSATIVEALRKIADQLSNLRIVG